jgi:molybdopterin-guanine dinucleotide biosynthesis protein A
MKESSHYTQQPVTGVILAGGKNIRMGESKAFLEIAGQRIIDRTVELFKGIFSQVILITNTPLEYSYLDIEIVIDIVPKRGALIGIYTGLFYSSHPYCFVTACDMPFLNRKVIEYMITISKDYDVVIPHLSDGYHPLHAIYSKKCINSIEKLIHEDNLKIIDFFDKIKAKEVTTDEINSLDPTLNSFLNINTPEDLTRIKGIEF